jgi:hypothetical protein
MKLHRFLAVCLLLLGGCFQTKNNLIKKNILLIINYNNAYYDSIPLLKKIYGKDFKNIVFYGPEAHPEVNQFRHHYGYFSYLAIADAMIKNPNHDGYLFLMDDCILSTWLLHDFDASKIWLGKLAWVNNCTMGAPLDLTKGLEASKWDWWNTPWGYESMTKALAEIPDRYKKTLEENFGPHNVVAGFSDVAYIPSKYKDQFIELALIFGKHRAFLELALPTIISCLTPKNEWLPLGGKSTYADYQFVRSYEHFNKDCCVNHPIKLSYKTNYAFVEKLFAQMT